VRKEEKNLALWYMRTEESMKVFGKMTGDMDRVLKNILMGIFMKASFAEAKLMVMEFTSGKMEKFMRGSGSMVKKMDRAYGKVR